LNTNLRLLLDECVTKPLEDMLRQLSSALNIESLSSLGISGIEDHEVVNLAIQKNRIVVTTETGLNHKKFKICRHPGIIVIAGRHRHEQMQADFFRRFLLSGHRSEADHAVTFLSENQARIKTASDDSIPDKLVKL
jgi:predicted nuclease of predicted toxin-antitoxin system